MRTFFKMALRVPRRNRVDCFSPIGFAMTMLIMLPFVLLTNCSKSEVTVEKEGRITLTSVYESQIDATESKKPFQFTPSKPIHLDKAPHAFSINHKSEHLFGDHEYIYLCSSKGLERFSLHQKKWDTAIVLPIANMDSPIYITMDAKRIVLVSRLGLLKVFDRNTHNLLFEKDFAAAVNADPLLDEEKIFIQFSGNFIHCVNAKNGEDVWTYRTHPNPGLAKGSSPVIHENFLITGFSTGDLSAINKNTGLLQWNDSLFGQISLFNNDLLHVSAKPIIEREWTYAIGSADSLAVFKTNTGELVWSKPIGSQNNMLINNNYLYALDHKGLLMALNKINGKIRMISNLKEHVCAAYYFTNMVVVNDMIFLMAMSKKDSQGFFIEPKSGKVQQTMTIKDLIKDVSVFDHQLVALSNKTLYVF